KSAIYPGMLIERDLTASVLRWKPHATAAAAAVPSFACDHPMANKGVDDVYATGDLVEAGVMQPGAAVWALIASGQTIVAGNRMESAGDGTLRVFGSGVVIAAAMESVTNNGTGTLVNGLYKRIRVETA